MVIITRRSYSISLLCFLYAFCLSLYASGELPSYSGPYVVTLSPNITISEVPIADQKLPYLSHTVLKSLSSHPIDILKTTDIPNSIAYITGTIDGKTQAGSGDIITTIGTQVLEKKIVYTIVRPGDTLYHPHDILKKQPLGVELWAIGHAQLITQNETGALLTVLDSTVEILPNDAIILHKSGSLHHKNMLEIIPAAKDISTIVIKSLSNMESANQYDLVCLDKGLVDNLKPGMLLSVMGHRNQYFQPTSKSQVSAFSLDVNEGLPLQKVGSIVIILAHPNISYGLVLENTTPIFPGMMLSNSLL